MDDVINGLLIFSLVVCLVFVLRQMHREMLRWRHEREDWFR